MEFLYVYEKRVSKDNGKNVMYEEKMRLVDEQMRKLMEDCLELYKHHISYYNKDLGEEYNHKLDDSRKRWNIIQQQDWKSNNQYLNLIKAKAGYFPGCVYVQKRQYDEALKYLETSMNLIEADSLQYIIPEYYISIIIEMAECYREKQSSQKIIEDWILKAENILAGKRAQNSEENDNRIKSRICRKYSNFYYNKLQLELKLQHIFIEMHAFSASQLLPEELKDVGVSNIYGMFNDAESFVVSCRRSYSKMSFRLRIFRQEISRDLEKDKDWYIEWNKEWNITLSTTKGDFFKDLNFKIKDIISRLESSDISGTQNEPYSPQIEDITKEKIKKRQEEIPDLINCCEKLLSELPKEDYTTNEEIQNSKWVNKIKELQEWQWFCIEMAFDNLADAIKEDSKNTISWNAVAALLYDYSSGGEKETIRDVCLLKLLKEYFPHIVAGNEQNSNRVKKCIEIIVNKVLGIECTNMFALNFKSALEQESIEKIGNYPALRQSSLKKRFIAIQKLVRVSHGGNEEPCFKILFQNVEASLVTLYNRVIRFMNAAIINWKEDGWDELEVGHYTRMKVLPKLINRGMDSRFRIQNVQYMNDPLEGALLIEQLKSRFENDVDSVNNSQNFLLDQLWSLYDLDKRGTVRNSVYMGSFTSRLDQLDMWERYGESGKGVSLKFNLKEYFDTMANISLSQMSTNDGTSGYKMENIKYPLYMVIYLPRGKGVDLNTAKEYAEGRAAVVGTVAANMRGDANDPEVNKWKKKARLEWRWWKKQAELIEKLNTLEREIITILRDIQTKYNVLEDALQQSQKEKLRREVCNTIMMILDQIRFLIKNDDYRTEREYRVIQYSSDPECDTEGTEIPILYIPIEKKLVYEKVCFGPLVTDFESKAAYVLNIRRRNSEGEKASGNIEVCRSEINYRKS